jgi:type VI secretion system secreted protein Hcp
MSVSSYCEAEGVPGTAKGKGVDGMIELYEYNYELMMPTDVRDGSITGRRKHGFFTITQEMGKQSPLFFKHLCENMEIPRVVVHHYRPDPANGELVKYFSHEMKQVKVVEIVQRKPNTCDPLSEPFRDMEDVRFKFEEIKCADTEGNEYTDKWEMG